MLASQGLTDNGISHRLGISLATVGTYWGRVRIKFGPLNRTELVAVWLREQSASTVAELRVQNERLVAEIDQLTKVESMLKSSLELFKGLVETAPDAILLVDEQGIIRLANSQADELFGYEPGTLLGVEVDHLVPERYRRTHVVNRQIYHENPVKRRMGEHNATFAVRKDGTEFPMATALSAVEAPSGLLITCIIRDLSEELRKQQPA